MQANRYVIDSNVYVSFIINRKLHKLAEIILFNDLAVYRCAELDAELKEVLGRPHIKNTLKGLCLNISD